MLHLQNFTRFCFWSDYLLRIRKSTSNLTFSPATPSRPLNNSGNIQMDLCFPLGTWMSPWLPRHLTQELNIVLMSSPQKRASMLPWRQRNLPESKSKQEFKRRVSGWRLCRHSLSHDRCASVWAPLYAFVASRETEYLKGGNLHSLGFLFLVCSLNGQQWYLIDKGLWKHL